LPDIGDRDRVLFVDAGDFGKEPGYIGVIENQDIPAFFAAKVSLHHTSLADLLPAAVLLQVAPREICLIDIQPQSIETGLELTELL
jgi:hydrogenase maturation protease